jgi:hypothetical protein
MYAIFAVMVVVLPVPAPARMSWEDWVCLMASSWRGFREERRESIEMSTSRVHPQRLLISLNLKNIFIMISQKVLVRQKFFR